jgi:hypothetical protein
MPHRPRRARPLASVIAGLALFTLIAACGDDQSTGYDDRVEREFLAACAAATPAEVCGCLYDRIADEIPFERFEEIDRDLTDPSKVPDDVTALAIGCATEVNPTE